MSDWRSDSSSAASSSNISSWTRPGWRDMTEVSEPPGPGNSQRPIDDVLRDWLNRLRPWRGGPWRPVRHITGQGILLDSNQVHL